MNIAGIEKKTGVKTGVALGCSVRGVLHGILSNTRASGWTALRPAIDPIAWEWSPVPVGLSFCGGRPENPVWNDTKKEVVGTHALEGSQNV